MTTQGWDGTPPETVEQFDEILTTLVQATDTNRLDIEGGYQVIDEDGRGWEAEIVRIEK